MIKLHKTRRDAEVQAVQFTGDNIDELKRINCFRITPIDERRLSVEVTFGEDTMNVGDYLVYAYDTILVLNEGTFNMLFTKGKEIKFA